MTKSNKSNKNKPKTNKNKPKTNKSNTPLPEVKPSTEDVKYSTPEEDSESYGLTTGRLIVMTVELLLLFTLFGLGYYAGYSSTHNSYLDTSCSTQSR